MNPTLKVMILKETKEIVNFKNYYQTLGIYVILSVILSLILCYCYISMESNVVKSAMVTNLIFIPVFLMTIYIIPFIKEKFNDEKIMKHFYAILATPISLTEVWLSKLISIFLLSYPLVIVTVVIFTIVCNLTTKINPLTFSPILWLIALFIAPMLPMIYVAISSWAILRFSHPRLLELLNLVVIGIAIISSLGSGQLSTSPLNENFLIPTTLIMIIGISIFFMIIWLMVKNIEKEKITI